MSVLDRCVWIRAASGALLLALASAAGAGEPTFAGDAWLTAKVKTALVMADGVESGDVDVDSLDGLVTLHGKVGSDAERTRAEAAVREVEGVRGIRNLLAVVEPPLRESVEAADAEIARAIARELERHPELGKSAIEVTSVNGGIVLLGGRAESAGSHQRALEAAAAVEGVQRVASAIHSPDARADAEIREREEISSAAPPSGLRAMASDAWITTKAKLRLLRALDLSPFAVEVDTSAGVVTVSGVVASGDVKEQAEAVLMEVDGVREVVNYLQVVPALAAQAS